MQQTNSMWIWLTLVALAVFNFASCSIDPIGNGFEEDPLSEEATIYVIADVSKPNLREIEEIYSPRHDLYDAIDLEDDYIHPVRARKRSFIRYGRNEKKIHVRFGRDTERIEQVPQKDDSEEENIQHVRYGRSGMLARGKRSTEEETDEQQNRKFTMDRPGRSSNYLRFGRNFPNEDSLEKFRLLSFLKHLAARQNNEYGYNGCSKDKRYSFHVRAGRGNMVKRSKRSVIGQIGQGSDEDLGLNREERASTHRRYGRSFHSDDDAAEVYTLSHAIPPAVMPYLKQVSASVDDEDDYSECVRDKRTSPYHRMGRSNPLKRRKRSVFDDSGVQQEKPDNSKMGRFGRTSTYMRFGRDFHSDGEDNYSPVHSISSILLPLLKQYAAQLNSKNRFDGYTSSA